MLTTSQVSAQEALVPTLRCCKTLNELRDPYHRTNVGLVISPKTIKSNNCLMVILSYTCGREDVKKVNEYNRLCRRAR